MTRNRAEIVRLAQACGFALEQEQAACGLLIFVSIPRGVQVNVYTTTMTVATSLRHPRKGSTQLFRRGVSFSDLRRIFKDPRVHTGRGYYGGGQMHGGKSGGALPPDWYL